MSVWDFAGKTMLRLGSYPAFKKEQKVAVDEISRYFKVNTHRALEMIAGGYEQTRQEWLQADPKTADDMAAAYANSEGYIFDLTNFNNFNSLEFAVRKRFAKECQGAKRVLDYGGGIGSICIHLWNESNDDPDITYYDLKGKCFDFAKWRFAQRGMKIGMLRASDREDRLEGSYDAIICLEVLEHVPDPEFHVERLVAHLRRGGTLFGNAAFGHTDAYPQHMDYHKSAREIFADAGLAELRFGPFDTFNKWVKP